MTTSRAGAWAGNASAMLDLFGKNKIVFPSQAALKPYMKTQAYCWEAFVLEAFPNNKKLLVELFSGERSKIPLSPLGTASAMVWKCLVREEFPILRENQKHSKWRGWCTTSGETTDKELLERSFIQPPANIEYSSEKDANLGFFLSDNYGIGFKIPLHLAYKVYKEEIDKAVVSNPGPREVFMLEVFKGFVVGFTSPFQNLPLREFLKGSLILFEQKHEYRNKKNTSFPTFYSVGCELLTMLVPHATDYVSMEIFLQQKKAILKEKESLRDVMNRMKPRPLKSTPCLSETLMSAVAEFLNKRR